ncbi:MAG: hypothetical protein QOK23_4430 [Gammaproteobacteria bacterium]|jgi:hypothetical protein|nr:hypothetical protein [Gammaproteobacteria bacterium]MEA3142261.1 hypothetical protein [Gammaproteobacteria bacterium]
MKAGSMRDWLPPTLGAALLLAGLAGLAYKVISGYQHPASESFLSVHDQNKLLPPSAVDHPVEAPADSADSGNSACVAIKTEQREIEGASHKTDSPEEGRYLQRRLLELAEQSDKRNCVK